MGFSEGLPSNADSLRVFDCRHDDLPHTGRQDEFTLDEYLEKIDDQALRQAVDAEGPWVAKALYRDDVTLASLRLKAGLSQKSLAERCGWQQPTIARYESGSTVPSVLAASKLAKALGVSVDMLVTAFENVSVQVLP